MPKQMHLALDLLDAGGERMAHDRVMGGSPLSRCRAVRGYRADRRARSVRHDLFRRWQRHPQHLGGWHRCCGAPGRRVAAARHEPMMSRVTSHVGFGLTYASTFMHPFYVARLLNSLDHITNGRIAFNVISSQRRSDYENYGYEELIDHGERYDRMEEFIAVCQALWSSVDADAFVWDRLNGLVADPAKVRPINHVGRFFKVKGPLSVVQSPQGHPVLIQAGGSKRGIWAAAGFVDHVFGAGKGIRLMAQQRDDMDAALRDRGRDPEQVGIVWATKVIVGETED